MGLSKACLLQAKMVSYIGLPKALSRCASCNTSIRWDSFVANTNYCIQLTTKEFTTLNR